MGYETSDFFGGFFVFFPKLFIFVPLKNFGNMKQGICVYMVLVMALLAFAGCGERHEKVTSVRNTVQNAENQLP